VVAGTAGAVHHRQQQRYAGQEQAAYESQQQAAMQEQMYQQQMQMQQMQQQMAQQQAAQAPAQAAASSPMMEQLNQLAQLHAAGVLDDAEFAAAKQKLLAGG
jgi:hypothetical protein